MSDSVGCDLFIEPKIGVFDPDASASIDYATEAANKRISSHAGQMRFGSSRITNRPFYALSCHTLGIRIGLLYGLGTLLALSSG